MLQIRGKSRFPAQACSTLSRRGLILIRAQKCDALSPTWGHFSRTCQLIRAAVSANASTPVSWNRSTLKAESGNCREQPTESGAVLWVCYSAWASLACVFLWDEGKGTANDSGIFFFLEEIELPGNNNPPARRGHPRGLHQEGPQLQMCRPM